MKLNPTKNTVTKTLWKYRILFLRYGWQLLFGLVMLVIVNICGVSVPLLIKKAIDLLQGIQVQATAGPSQNQWHLFYQTLWLIAGIATVSLVSRILSRLFLLGVGRHVEFDLRNRIFGHLLKMPPAYHTAHPAGELMSRMINDVDATKFLTGGGLMLGGNTLFAYLFVIPMMFKLNWQLSIVTFLFYPFIIWTMGKISKKVRLGYKEVQEVLADISTVSQENLNGMSVIQSYAMETRESQRFEALCDKYFGTYTRLIRERILLFMVLGALSGFSVWLVLLVGGSQVIWKTLDWGGFVAFMMYLEYLSWPTMALGWTISIFQQGIAGLERIDDVLSTDSNIQSIHETKSNVPPADFRGDIEIRHLNFAYQNPYKSETDSSKPHAEHSVLQDINLKIAPGETIAFVGSVGSGKSTLLRLLPRLENISQEAIYLDGQDITQMNIVELRRQMVLMPQISFLFSTTVNHNIAFGKPSILEHTDFEKPIAEAAKTANVHNDILNLSKQYQTLVGERGVMLSGGQRQRVALARSILMDAPVLLLDDPFSNVDGETERRIVNALRERKIFHHKTTLIATHRFSLIALCDRVALMDAGQIIAIGSHQELLATQPLYQKLHRLQELRESLGTWGLELDTQTEQDKPDWDEEDELDMEVSP